MTAEKETWTLDWEGLLASGNEEHIQIVSGMWREYLSYSSMVTTKSGNLLLNQSLRDTLLQNLKSKGHLKKVTSQK
jgi:hypothetical protein